MDPTTLPIKDLRYPPELDWWPFAIGWWLIIIILFSVSSYLAYKLYLRWLENQSRRIALSKFEEIQSEYIKSGDSLILVKQLSILLRRTFLAYFPREEVSSLVGIRWLNFLDQGLNENFFTEGVGKKLAIAPYQDQERPDHADMELLLKVVKIRIKTPIKIEGIS